jgi:hypothetical protein
MFRSSFVVLLACSPLLLAACGASTAASSGPRALEESSLTNAITETDMAEGPDCVVLWVADIDGDTVIWAEVPTP